MLDDQTTGMLWALQKAGVPVTEMRYRITVKPQLKRGRPTKAKPGGESLSTFHSRIKADIASRHDYYFREYRLTRTPDQLREHEAELTYFVTRLQWEEQQGVWPKNNMACDDYGGCKYIDVCSGALPLDRLGEKFSIDSTRRNKKHDDYKGA